MVAELHMDASEGTDDDGLEQFGAMAQGLQQRRRAQARWLMALSRMAVVARSKPWPSSRRRIGSAPGWGGSTPGHAGGGAELTQPAVLALAAAGMSSSSQLQAAELAHAVALALMVAGGEASVVSCSRRWAGAHAAGVAIELAHLFFYSL
uniref:Uncharacterized protein n=1 Tax=Arundo donax TaxID=35708 RepID=A0A0A8YWQ8_ARUDO